MDANQLPAVVGAPDRSITQRRPHGFVWLRTTLINPMEIVAVDSGVPMGVDGGHILSVQLKNGRSISGGDDAAPLSREEAIRFLDDVSVAMQERKGMGMEINSWAAEVARGSGTPPRR